MVARNTWMIAVAAIAGFSGAALAAGGSGSPTTPSGKPLETVIDAGIPTLLGGSAATGPESSTLYDNTPVGAELVTTTGSMPRTGAADEALFNGSSALLTSMKFGFSRTAAGPSAFDAIVTFWDDAITVGTSGPQFTNQAGQFRVAFTDITAGAFITAPLSLTSNPGGGVSVTANADTVGAPNVVDVYFQVQFVNTGTNTPVAADGVTWLFDTSGVNIGRTFADLAFGGDGTALSEFYWRDVNNDGVIGIDESRSLTGARANLALQLEGTVNSVPEPTSIAIASIGFLGLAARRRRR